MVCSAVGETIQFTLDTTNELITAALACWNLSTTVSAPSVVMGSVAANCQRGRQVQVDWTSRLKLKATASASNGVPSVNLMPGLILIRTVLPPSANSYPLAWCGTTLALVPSSLAMSRNSPP